MILIFISAGAAGKARRIVAMCVVLPANLKTSEKLKEDIARPKKGKRTTEKRKTAVDKA